MPGRRTHRRCYSILGALHEHGPQPGLELCQILRCGPGTLYPELAILERDGLIIGYWVSQGMDRPRRRCYRIADATDRFRHERRREAGTLEPVPVPRRRRLLWGTGWQPGDAS